MFKNIHGSRALASMMIVAAGAVLFFGTAPVRAAGFDVSPVEVVLGGHTRSQLLTLRNVAAHPIRFQLSASSWQQDASGKMTLKPTDDIIFFPQLLSLAPGESRKIRVGSLVPPGMREKTYRLAVQQLRPPPASASEEGASTPKVQILVRMSIPVFIEPVKPMRRTEIGDTRLSSGVLSFDVKNTGNVHVVVRKARVTGVDGGGQSVFSRQARGWYVLAGEQRDYQLPALSNTDCLKVRSLDIQVSTDHGQLKKAIPVQSGSCTTMASSEGQ